MSCPNCGSDQTPHRCTREYVKSATGVGVEDGRSGDSKSAMHFDSYLVRAHPAMKPLKY